MSSDRPMRLVSGRALVLISAATVAVYLAIVLGTADRLGAEGRHYYLTRQIPLDAAYPALLAIWLVALWSYMVDKLGWSGKWLGHVWKVPVLAVGFDYAENVAVASLLLSYPELDTTTVRLASAFTIAKSALSTLCFTAVLVVGGLLAHQRLRPAS